GVIADNKGARAREAVKAETIIDAEVDAFWRWFTSLDVVPTIVALRDKVEGIRRRELARALAAVGDADPRMGEVLERVTSAIVNKILHGPLTALRRHEAQAGEAFYVDAARRLFRLGAVPERADARDVLIGGDGGLAGLPPGARIGTASPRRRAQLLAHRPDLVVVLLRGNVDTRLRKWRAGEVDALLLAAAGLARLGISEPAAQPLPVDEFLPAVGQGALALECRADDGATRALLAAVDQPAAATPVAAERAFLAAVGGDCNSA